MLLDSSTAPQAVADFLATDELELGGCWRGSYHPSTQERHEALARTSYLLDSYGLLTAAFRRVIACAR